MGQEQEYSARLFSKWRVRCSGVWVMLTASEFLERSVLRGRERGRYPVPSPLRGPVVVLRGWREGMQKVRAEKLLRQNGVPLPVAYDAINSILNGQPVEVRLQE